MTDYDFEIMAKTIYGEARGESRQGQKAVACVIFNRFRSGKWFAAKTLAGVCLKPLQFSCWNKSDPNSQILANLPYSAYSRYFDVIKEATSRAAQRIIAPMPRCRIPSGQKEKSRVLSAEIMYFLRGLTNVLFNICFNCCGLKRFVARAWRIVQRIRTGK